MNYVVATSRPDITFAMHECTRFSSAPTQKHEVAVRCIVRYLKGIRDKGYTLKPSDTPTLNCYVDADFAGSWTKETATEAISVHSRTGYTITFADCPILWTSKIAE
jgi:hypothetical protein